MLLVPKRDSKESLGNAKPKGINKHVEGRNPGEVVRLDVQNAFDRVSLQKA